MEIDQLLLSLGLAGVPIRYFREILEISLERGYVPFGVYRMAAVRTGSTEFAVQKAVSHNTPGMWRRGSALKLWTIDDLSVSPRYMLTEMTVLLSRK